MAKQSNHDGNEIAAAVRSASPEIPPHQTLYTVEQFAIAEPAFTAPAIRNLIFKAEPRYSSKGKIPGNGLLEAGAIIRQGRKVIIHRERFLAWLQK